MKARDVSVMLADYGGELYVNITLKLRGHSLERETPIPGFSRVSDASRKRKAKELQKFLESIDFPEGKTGEQES